MTKKPLRLAFAGTPVFAATILQRLLESGRQIERVLTQPPRRAGRGRKISPSPVQILSEKAHIDTIAPRRKDLQPELLENLDMLLVAAYGVILPSELLHAPRLGCINVHASLLPRWRGASPIEHAILAGDSETGVSIMKIESELDAGPIFSQSAISIRATDTTACLTAALAELGATSLNAVVAAFEQGNCLQPTPQDHSNATYAPQLSSKDARISWTLSAEEISRHVRAFNGRQSAFATLGDVRLKVLSVTPISGSFAPARVVKQGSKIIIGCGDGGLALDRVQLNRGKGVAMTALDAANGYPQILGNGIELDIS